MTMLIPAILVIVGLLTNRNPLVWIGIALFVWLSWSRKAGGRANRARLWSVPLDSAGGGGGILVSDYARPIPDGGPPSCGCA
jgi:hypothetical protein